jgi:hypothetical protein
MAGFVIQSEPSGLINFIIGGCVMVKLKAFEWTFSYEGAHGYALYHLELQFQKFVDADAKIFTVLSNKEYNLIAIKLRFYEGNFKFSDYILVLEEEISDDIDNIAPDRQWLETVLNDNKIYLTINTDNKCYLTVMNEKDFNDYIKENY